MFVTWIPQKVVEVRVTMQRTLYEGLSVRFSYYIRVGSQVCSAVLNYISPLSPTSCITPAANCHDVEFTFLASQSPGYIHVQGS